MAEVLYRKWRPRSFGDIAGQEPVSRTLLNAVGQGRVAHAYLLCGPRGTGKTSTGRILAKAVNCESPAGGEPCDKCPSCRAFSDGSALDLIEIDAASNRGIDEIRNLRDTAAFHPVGKTKVYLIDEVHMLTEPAFNALLKILEEPPPHVIFILATTEPQRVLATILSRCQRFNFRRVPLAAIVERLATIAAAEGFTIDEPGLDLLARSATGSLRDAINLMEQAVAYHGSDLTIDHVRDALGISGDTRTAGLARAALRRDLPGGLGIIAAVRDDGIDLRQFSRELVQHLRALLLVRAGAEVDLPVSAEALTEMRAAIAEVTTDDLVRALRAFGAADFRSDRLSSLPLELALAECTLARERAESLAAKRAPAASTVRTPEPRPQPASRPAPAAKTEPQPETRPRLRALPEVEREAPPPASPTQREAPPPDDDAPPEVQRARQRWSELFNLTRTLDKRAGALLNSACDIIEVDEAGVRMTFGFRHAALAQKLATGDGGANLSALTQAVQQVFGKPYTVACRHEPSVVDRQKTASGLRGPLVREALDLGARIVGER